MKKTIQYFIYLVLFTLPQFLTAVPATPFPIERTLPDGSKLTILLRGDEYYNYTLSEDGYLIRENEQGYFTYVEVDAQGNQYATGLRVRPKDSRPVEEQIFTSRMKAFPDLQRQYSLRRAARESETGDEPQRAYPNTGSPKSLVILVNYTDIKFQVSSPQQAFTNLLNQEGYSENGGKGSARDYFRTASSGVSSPEFIVVGPFNLPNDRAYYGGNNSSDDDQRPREMIADACIAASAAGVDFSVYDTDNDGIVDNVFVYYAGHNEAEGGPDESIWPHRWQLNTTLMLNGKRISGYACTSEMRGSSGTSMCGIGTFAHEFGHVYGLVDYYATNGANHHTLSYWNIMDAGAYLNLGRTPPTYSAYDRFYAGWLTPTLLKSPQDVVLPDLKTSNKAYILTATDSHNMSGTNPNPTEFILLEYRSRTGWDEYLPNSGMLATRIVYNRNDWYYNQPNNNASAMGVDIIEADGVGSTNSLAGDTYPGSANISTFTPRLRSGVDMGKPITHIREANNAVTFRFMGGGNPPTIKTSLNSLVQFNTIFGQTPPQQEIGISAVNLIDSLILNFSTSQHFEMKLKEDNSNKWSRRIAIKPTAGKVDTTTILVRYNPQEPSYIEVHYDFLIVRSTDADTWQTSVAGQSTRQVYVVPPVAQPASYSTLEGFEARWNKVFDASGYYLTVFGVGEGKSSYTEDFANGLRLPAEWESNSISAITTAAFSGNLPPAIELKNNDDYLATEPYPIAVDSFFFFVRSIGESTGKLAIEGYNGSDWITFATLSVGTSLRGKKTYPVPDNSMRRFRVRFTKGTASVSIDDMGVSFNQQLAYLYKNDWVTDTLVAISDVIPSLAYHYKVKASDRTLYPNKDLKYENITAFSNIVEVTIQNASILQFTQPDAGLRIFTDNAGNTQVSISDENLIGTYLRIYAASGRLIKSTKITSTVVSIPGIIPNQVYILKSAKGAVKFRL